MKVAIIVFDRFTDIDVFMPWDLFSRVRFKNKDWSVKFLGTKESHLSAGGIELKMHGQVEESSSADIVFFASGSGTRQLYQNREYLSKFKLDPARQVICSMCSGALLLAGLGLLEGISATTYPTVISELKAMNVDVVEDSHLVTHGNIGTAAGCLAAVDLIRWALDRTVGKDISEQVIASVLPVGQGQVCIY